MVRRLLGVLLSGAFVLASAAGWAGQGQVRIGVLLPLTGPAAAYGQMALRGLRMAYNERPTVLGRAVRLVIADTKGDKVEASNAANRLIQRDRVVAIIGALSSSTTLAAAPVAEKARIPLVTGWATNPLVTQGRRWVFRTCFIDPFQGKVAATFAYKDLGLRTAAVMIDISRDYSVGLGTFFARAFKALGGRVVVKIYYTSGDQDFSAQLGIIKSHNPQLIYLPGYLPEEPLIIRQAREMGLNQPFISGDAAQADEVIKIGGKAVEGLYLTTHFDEQGVTTKVGRHYTATYRKLYGKAPDAMGALGYDAYNVVLAAIAKAGKPEPGLIREALEGIRNFEGVCGVMSLVGHDAIKPAVILKVEGGRFVYVTTVKP